MKLAVVILAAGASRRLGRPKQLVRLAGQTLLGRAVDAAFGASAGEVYVVVGAYADLVRKELLNQPVTIVENLDWVEGIASSIRAGVGAALSALPNLDGVMMMTCDQPRVVAANLRELVRAFEECGGGQIVASEYAGVAGIPAIYPRAEWQALLALKGDEGARKTLRGAEAQVVRIPLAGGEVDVDTPADLERIATA